jgi:hypothetical protein
MSVDVDGVELIEWSQFMELDVDIDADKQAFAIGVEEQFGMVSEVEVDVSISIELVDVSEFGCFISVSTISLCVELVRLDCSRS